MPSGARDDVLAFCRELPFNFRVDAKTHAASVRRGDPLRAYPPLVSALAGGRTLIDIGSGAGWLVNSAAYHHHATAFGIDFNPTDDCLGAVRHIAQNVVAPGGRVSIGLYHLHGRRPFLDHFAAMRRNGASEEAMYEEFKLLRTGGPSSGGDDVFLRSWFRDQVPHPHETCHTLAEIWPLLDELGLELISTTVNRFGPVTSREAIFALERAMEEAGQGAPSEKRYYPGFFAVLAHAPKSSA